MVWLVFKVRAGGEECKEKDDLDHGIKPLYLLLSQW